MNKYDYRDQDDFTGWTEISNEQKLRERIQMEMKEYAAAHSSVYRQDRRDAFYRTFLPVLKHFSFIHSAVLEVEETNQTIVAKISCKIFHIMEEDAAFMKVFDHADLKSITVSGENLPVITLYFPCTEIVRD